MGDLILKHVMKPIISKKLITVSSNGLNQNSDDNYESSLKLVDSPLPQVHLFFIIGWIFLICTSNIKLG